MLRTITQKAVHRAIAKIFLAYGKPQAERIAVYEEILAGLPIRIVEEACDYAVKGKLGKPEFMPSAGELYQLGQELLTREYCKAKAERERRYKEPESKTTPQQRERMVARFRELLHDLKTGKPIPVDQTFEPFDPTAETFSPYRLGMTKEQIIAKVKAYRAGI